MIKVLDLIEQEQRYLKGVSAMFASRLIDPEEVLSKFYLRICQGDYEVDSLEGFKSWCYIVIKSISINDYRAATIRPLGNAVEIQPDIDYSYTPSFYEVDYFKLLSESDALSDKEKMVIKMRLEGYKYREISDALNIPLGTSKTSYKYAITRFRNELREKRMV